MNILVISIFQNLLPQGKYSWVIALNCQYRVLWKKNRDNFQLLNCTHVVISRRLSKGGAKTVWLFISGSIRELSQRLHAVHRDISRGSTDHVHEKNMSRKVSQNWAFLNLLATASVKQRRSLLKTISFKRSKSILKVIQNVIHNREILPSDSFIKSIYKYRQLLRRMAKKKCKDKKTLVLKRQGFLPILLEP